MRQHNHHTTLPIPARMSDDDLQRIKWAGWTVAGMVMAAWGGWISLVAIATQAGLGRTEERQQNQYQQLRDDVAELKALIQEQLHVDRE